LAARGERIKLLSHPNQITANGEYIQRNFPIAQEYIQNPQLLHGYKVSLRFYVLLTSFNPLRVYMYQDAIVRMCTEKYTTTYDSVENLFAHLDSIDINKHNNLEKFEEDWKDADCDVIRESIRSDYQSVLRLWKKRYGVGPVSKLLSDIKYLVGASVISGEESISNLVAQMAPHRGAVFELVGYDVLVDENLKPWLLEINRIPSLAPETQMGNSVKKAMLHDLFDLMDFEKKR